MVDPGHRPGGFFDELKRRRVVRVAIAYGAAVFVLLQLADIILPALDYSDEALRPFLIAAAAGLPLVLLLAWLYDLTPEGVVRTAGSGEGRGRVVLSLSRRLALGLGVFAFAAIAGGLLLLRPGGAEGAVPEDARVIAVMPFHGASEGIMAEGVMDLLSRNLDGIGSIRTIDPLRTTGRLADAEQAGEILEGRAREVGAALGAGSVLTGVIASGAGTVRISADLIATADGNRLATATVEGPETELFALLDELSSKILRIVWRGGDLPTFDLASFTTGNFDAIRAFLEGERYYRASQWDSAMASFARAIDEDEEFALAYYRFANAAGWGGSFRPSQIGRSGRIDPSAGDLVRQAAELAREYSAGLPERERMLIAAQWLRANDRRAEALDTIRALVERFPDDIEAAYQQADDVYHLRDEPSGLLGRPLEEQLGLFEDVLDKEPGFRPALIHPIEMAFAAGRLDLVERYLAFLRPSNPLDDAALETYQAGLQALEEHDVFGYARAFETALAAREQTGFVWQAANGVLPALLVAAARLDADDRDELVTYLTDGLADLRPETRERRALMAADLLIASGRAEEAVVLLADPSIARLVGEARAIVEQRAAFAGLLPPSELEAGWAGVAARALAAIDAADAGALRRALREVADPQVVADSALRGRLETGLRPFLTLLAGDTAAGLSAAEAGLERRSPREDPLDEALWFRWAVAAVRDPDARPRALEALARTWPESGIYEVGRLGLRAIGLAAAGDAGAGPALAAWCAAAPEGAYAAAGWARAPAAPSCEDAPGIAGADGDSGDG